MNEEERATLTALSNTLRAELKSWEKTFAAANSGMKASRDDIKKHPDIGIVLRTLRLSACCTDTSSSRQVQGI